MENDSMALLLQCIKTASEIEQSPFGQEHDDVRVEEMFMTDLLQFFVFLSYSSGEAHKREIKFVNQELNYDFSKETFERYAKENVFPIEKYRYKVPLSFQYFLRAEYKRNRELFTTYRGICDRYIKAFRSVGQELIACDGIVSQEEIDNLSEFCKTLSEEQKEWKDTDIYSKYGRHQIPLESEEQSKREYAMQKEEKTDKPRVSKFSWTVREPGQTVAAPEDDNFAANQAGMFSGVTGNPSDVTGGRFDSADETGRSLADTFTVANVASHLEQSDKAVLTQGEKKQEAVANEQLDGLLKELNSMIGLASVKEQVKNLINKLNISKMRVEQGFDPLPIEMHLVFTGNPGTGKTTVARLLAKIYYAMGVLSKGNFIETDRSGLVAGYMGQTAEKTQEVIESALGGVLFIDEAYALANGNKEDFGQEAIDTLVKAMEDNRDDLIVIVAGYTNEMKEFLDTNPGLQSRFNTYVDFPDYEAFDLVSILIEMCKKMQYVLAPDAVTYVFHYFENALQHKDENFGNARDVRNYLTHIIDRQINRITKDGIQSKMDLVTIRLEDVQDVRLGGGIMS